MNLINRSVIIITLISLFAISVHAQTPAPAQQNSVAITGATIYTISGDVIEDGIIIFDEGIITAIGTGIDIPEGTKLYDATGKFVYPGLIDSYTNMGLTEIGAVDVTSDFNEHGQINPNVRAEKAFHPESEHIPVARSHGVAVTISSPSGSLISGLSAAMMMDGWTWERMTLRSSVGLLVNWPLITDDDTNARDQVAEIRNAFTNARAYKKARAESNNHRTDMKWESMIPVLKRDIPVIVQANTSRQIEDAINWAETENLRLIILGGRDAIFVADQLTAKEIPVIITTVLTSPGRPWQGYDEVYTQASGLYQAGVRFAITGEYGSANAMRLRHHAATAAAFGLPEDEAIKAITLYPAEILGLSDRIGSLDEGKDATLMITDGNILDLRSGVEQMFIQGRTIDMTDKQKLLFDRYREKYRQLSGE